MRKLASVQRIYKIEPIEGADRIELAHVLGWQCVVPKGQFTEMDLCVYFEIDSFLPVAPEFEFLRQSYKKNDLNGEGFLLKTKIFKKKISQGLIMRLEDVLPAEKVVENSVLGKDLTLEIGVREWKVQEMASGSGTVIGGLPAEVKKTDETRIQTCPELLKEFADKEYYITTKMDGSSHSICIDSMGNFHVTSHNCELKDDGKSPFYEFVKKHELEQLLRLVAEKRYSANSITVQGEWCGPGVQKNRLKLQIPNWYVFTVDINGERQDWSTICYIANYLDVHTVPLEEIGNDLTTKYSSVDDLLKRADGKYPNGGPQEGIVIRPTTPVYSDLLGADLSMKVINNKYLGE